MTTETKLNYVVSAVAPVAAFTGTPLSGPPPLSVTFTDTTTNSPTSWLWEKNDGSGWVNFSGTPNAQNPTEDFAAGTWSVRLTATNACDSDTHTETDYVESLGFASWNPNDKIEVDLSNSNLTASNTNALYGQVRSTGNDLRVERGRKLYTEIVVDSVTAGNGDLYVGIKRSSDQMGEPTPFPLNSGAYAMLRGNGSNVESRWTHNGGTMSVVATDVIGIAFDEATGKLFIAKNNTWLNSGDPVAGTGWVYQANAGIMDLDHALIFATDNNAGVTTVTMRSEAADHTYAAPTGYTADWPDGNMGGSAWNPADKTAGATLSESDRTVTITDASYEAVRTDDIDNIRSGGEGSQRRKFYFEAEVVQAVNAANILFGLKATADAIVSGTSVTDSGAFLFWKGDGTYVAGGAYATTETPPSYVQGDILMVAVSEINSSVWFGKNGTWNNGGDPAANSGAATNTMPNSDPTQASICVGSGNSGDDLAIRLKTQKSQLTYAAPAGFSTGI